MKKLITYHIPTKVVLIILVTALLLIEVSASEQHVIAQGELTDEELADTLVMETVAALDWDQTGEYAAFELEHYLTNANATYFVAGGNAFFYYALVSVFPTDEDAEAYLQQVLNHEAMTKQVLWSGPEENWGTWWWSRDSQPATFHGIDAVQAHHQGYEPSQGPYFLGWPMRNFFIGCFETPSTNSGGYKLGCTEFLYQTALNYGLGTESPAIPNPPNLNQNPEPGSNPDSRDIEEVIKQINDLVSNPAVPITGALAGTLLAALLVVLRGGLPAPVRNLPPSGRSVPKAGQVDANGRVYSPVSKSWVSPQMYEYQKNWSEKGWRWNAQTGRFEGQHGAVNENGQVLDEELGWVDQKNFQQNEQMRAEGMVYDRNLGWQTPEDLNHFESEREGIRQRAREFSAEKNAQIQRELKEAQAQRDQAFREVMRKINARSADEIKADMEMYQKRAQRYLDRDKQLENYAYIAEKVEMAADIAIAVCARLTGPAGKTIAAAYESVKEVAVIADDVSAADDKIGRAQELQQEKIEEEQKEKIKEKVEEKISPYVPKGVNRFLKKITKPIKKIMLKRLGKTGLIIYQEVEKKLVDAAKDEAEGLVEEQIEAATEKVKEAIDPYLLTGT